MKTQLLPTTSLRQLWHTLGDPTRLRLLALVRGEELSVAELQEIMDLAQSRISTHLSVLKNAGLVLPRREGKHTYYSLQKDLPSKKKNLLETAWITLKEITEATQDQKALQIVLEKRRSLTRAHFNQIAGHLQQSPCPCRGWSEVGPLLAEMIPHIVVADLGAGEGWLSQLLAEEAQQVIAIDNSPKMVAFGKAEAEKKRILNLEYRLGELDNPPIALRSVDMALLSQALHHAVRPSDAIQAATKILKPGGRLLILDLHQHQHDQARQRYGDTWLGFNEADLQQWLQQAGLERIRIRLLPPETRHPYFQPLLASARKPSSRPSSVKKVTQKKTTPSFPKKS